MLLLFTDIVPPGTLASTKAIGAGWVFDNEESYVL